MVSTQIFLAIAERFSPTMIWGAWGRLFWGNEARMLLLSNR